MTGRGLYGRRVARFTLVAVLALDVVLALLITNAPTGMGGQMMGSDPQSHLGWLIAAIGATFHLIGLAWMLRIYRSDPEAHASFWRSHGRD